MRSIEAVDKDKLSKNRVFENYISGAILRDFWRIFTIYKKTLPVKKVPATSLPRDFYRRNKIIPYDVVELYFGSFKMLKLKASEEGKSVPVRDFLYTKKEFLSLTEEGLLSLYDSGFPAHLSLEELLDELFKSTCFRNLYRLNFRDYLISNPKLKKVVNSNQGDPTLTPRLHMDIRKDSSREKRKGVSYFFVTSVMPRSTLFKEGLESIKTFKKYYSAELVVLPMRGVHHTHIEYSNEIKEIAEHFVTDYKICDNLRVMELQISPMAKNPLTGISKLVDKESLVVAHTKQFYKGEVVDNRTKPKSTMSTGVLTFREYPNTGSGYQGEKYSVLGGVVIEVDHDRGDTFYTRFVQFNKDGSFSHLGKLFTPKGVELSPVDHIYLGDLHAGQTDDFARKGTLSMINDLKPKEIYVGDVFDGYSISHHHEHSIKIQALRKPEVNTLKKELDCLGEELETFLDNIPEDVIINIVRSNHDEHLDKYLDTGRFVKDRVNAVLASELFGYFMLDKNPIETYIRKNFPKVNTDRVRWLTYRDSIRKTPKEILTTAHGHLGPNGAKKAQLHTLEKAYRVANVGHSHTPGAMRGIFQSGTLALFMSYTMDSATSIQVQNIVTHEDGSRHLVWIDFTGAYKSPKK